MTITTIAEDSVAKLPKTAPLRLDHKPPLQRRESQSLADKKSKVLAVRSNSVVLDKSGFLDQDDIPLHQRPKAAAAASDGQQVAIAQSGKQAAAV